MTTIHTAETVALIDNLVLITTKESLTAVSKYLKDENYAFVKACTDRGTEQIILHQESRLIFIDIVATKTNLDIEREAARKAGAKILSLLRKYKLADATLVDLTDRQIALSYAEGLALANYQFLKYYKDADKRKSPFTTLRLLEQDVAPAAVHTLNCLVDAVYKTRDLVNEPLSYLTAPQFAIEMEKLAESSGMKATVFDKDKIEALGMGGLLAVNKGSTITPPTFTILEWQPANAVNKKPIVLVGKGVVYDTGGVSLKPTANSMDFMKCDMAGAAAVVGGIYAIAKAKIPVHVVCLVPSTDNRPGVDAYVPGDVVNMYSGSTVEVLNTDAEGRMLLADALHYAKHYEPELVLDFATLTGAAAHAIGTQGAVMMGNATEQHKNAFKEAGYRTYERLVEFPLWEEYADQLKSDIADIKNLGSGHAGAITAGKFLEHFTDYPWIHFDIAGSSWLHQEDSYRLKGGTGYGVRLLFEFLQNYGK